MQTVLLAKTIVKDAALRSPLPARKAEARGQGAELHREGNVKSKGLAFFFLYCRKIGMRRTVRMH